jgi:hypothetical protein
MRQEYDVTVEIKQIHHFVEAAPDPVTAQTRALEKLDQRPAERIETNVEVEVRPS